MTENSIWHISRPASQKYWIEWHESMDFEQVTCPAFEGHRRAGKRIGDLHVVLKTNLISDVIWTWYNECLIQDHVRTLLEDAKLTGYQLRQVKVDLTKGDNAKLPILWEIQLTGWGGIAPEESGIIMDMYCEYCGLRHYSDITSPDNLFDKKRWDGSELFMIWPLSKYIFTVDRVAKLFRSENISGVELKTITSINKTISSGYTPGRLSYYMPIERAREIGIPLGIF